MANFDITTILGPYVDADAAVQFTNAGAAFTAAPVGTHTFSVSERGVLFMVRNTSATAAAAIELPSANLFGRTAEIDVPVAAGALLVRKFVPVGWESNSGSRVVNFEIKTAACEVLVIGL